MQQHSISEHKAPRKGRFLWLPLFMTVGALAFMMGWLAPNHYPPWLSFHSEAGIFVALPAFGAAVMIGRNRLYLDNAPTLIFATLVAIVWLQWSAGMIAFSGDAAMSSFYLAGFALAWWLGTNSVIDETQMSTAIISFAALMIAAALISLFVAVVQWLGMASVLGNLAAERALGGRPFANLAQPNHLATLQLMGIMMSCLLLVQRVLKQWQCQTLVVALTFGLVLTESRAGWVSAGALGALFLWRAKRSWGLGGWKTVVAWWALLLLMASTWKPLNEAMLLTPTRAGSISELVQDSPRLTIWRQMIAAIEQAPWLGYGWRQTAVAQKVGANFVAGVTPTDYAHSVILDVLLWLGIPIGLLVLLLIAWWVLRAVLRIESATQLLLLAGTLPVCIHSLVEFPFAYAYFLFPVGWMLGATSALQSTSQRDTWCLPRRSGKMILAGFVVVFAGVCGWVGVEYVQAEEDHRVMRFEMRKVGRTPVDYEAPRLILLNQLGEMLQLARLEPHPNMSPKELQRMRVANASFEWATLHLRYAIALGLNGQPEEASRQLSNLRALYGKTSYEQAAVYFRDLQDKRYPQLASVKIP